MIKILAIALCLLLMFRVLATLIFPTHMFDTTPTIVETINKHSTVIQLCLVAISIVVFFLLCMFVNLFTILATGWFWLFAYAANHFPLIAKLIKKSDSLREITLDPKVSFQLRLIQLPLLVLSIATVALVF